MKKIIVLLFVLVSGLVIYSCRRDKHIPNVCFKKNIQPLLISKCANSGCHNATDKADGYDFTTYEGVMKAVTPNKANRSELYQSISGSNPKMPQGGAKLTQKELDYIKYWIDFGAENSSCGTGTASVSNCDTTSALTYSNAVKGIIDLNCIGCHSTYNNYSAVSMNANTILTRINLPTTNAQHMPQGFSLSTCDIAKIQKWISLGKPEQ
jgi:uncharacterized membrane protein